MSDLGELKSPTPEVDLVLDVGNEAEKIEAQTILVFLEQYDERLKILLSCVREAFSGSFDVIAIKAIAPVIRQLANEIRIEARTLNTGDKDGYIRHDTNNVLSWSVMSLQECARYAGGAEQISFQKELSEEIEDAYKSWLVYKLIMQDVACRYREGEDVVSDSAARIDQEHNIGDLITALDQLFNKKLKKTTRVMIDIDPHILALKITAPHGLVFNTIQNVLGNALAKNVGAESLVFRVRQADNEIVFSLYDDGAGMPVELLQRDNPKFICNKGTSGKGSTGLGLAFADKRLSQTHASLIITSRQKLMSEGYDTIHSFPPAIAVKPEPVELDREEGAYSTCFQIRVPII